MFLYLRSILLFVLLIHSYSVYGTSLFHSYITDLSPPYICKLKLKSAHGVSIDNKHSYQFSGICSIKLPIGTTWIYQNVWVDVKADWDGNSNEGLEVTTLYNNLGSVIAQLKCDDDPWISQSQCALVGYQNNTSYTNLGGVFNNRNGQYPPYEIITGQYPPLARNQAILQETIALSLLAATQEAKAANTAFSKTFPIQTTITTIPTSLAIPKTIKRKHGATQVFKHPQLDNLRVDCCLKLNKECGKPAADQFCQRMGYRHAIDCKIDTAGSGPTFIIGTQTICNRPYCKGFKEIVCGD